MLVSTPKIPEVSYAVFKIILVSTSSGLVNTAINGKIEATPIMSIKAIIKIIPTNKTALLRSRLDRRYRSFFNFCSIKIIEDEQWGQAMHATLGSDQNIDIVEFKKELKNHLPNFMIPKKIILIYSSPRVVTLLEEFINWNIFSPKTKPKIDTTTEIITA